MYGEIYKITNKINGKVYIGQTTRGFRIRYEMRNDIDIRYGLYLYHKKYNDMNDKHCNKRLLKDLEEYGYENFEIKEKIDKVFYSNKNKRELKEELNSKEKYWIRYYNSTNPDLGYNISHGGWGDKINSSCIKVVCLNNGKVFPSLAIASNYVGIKCYDDITCCCKNKQSYAGKLKNGEYATWAFYDDYIKMTEDDILNKINKIGIQQRIKQNNRMVICLNNEKVFKSVRKCGEYFNVNHGRISECCKGDKDFIIIDGIEYRFKYYKE